jgi:PAS domain-containing protein
MGIVTVLGVGMAIVVVVRLRKHNRLLITVTDGLPQGVCMFDGSARRVFCNQRYLELYRLTPQHMVPGTTLRDVLEQCLTTRTFVGDSKRFAADSIAKIVQGKVDNSGRTQIVWCNDA